MPIIEDEVKSAVAPGEREGITGFVPRVKTKPLVEVIFRVTLTQVKPPMFLIVHCILDCPILRIPPFMLVEMILGIPQ